MSEVIKPPFPWFGGKSRIAPEIWERFGVVQNYVEPFFGSGAVLFGNPHPPKTETINDKDGFVANFWRAVQSDPYGVSRHSDWPVNERDLEARHSWLVREGRPRLDALLSDPTAYDVQIAGWWVWGICIWIGTGWCDGRGPWTPSANGEWIKLPHLGDAGKGINRKLPHLGDAGKGVHRPNNAWNLDYLSAISRRLRSVRVACGEWDRILGPSITSKHGHTAILLDPPYGEGSMDYAAGGNSCASVADEVRAWAIANGDNSHLRIALCGYDGGLAMPSSWSVHAYSAPGGYGTTGSKNTAGCANRHREVVWFSPHCEHFDLFSTPSPKGA